MARKNELVESMIPPSLSESMQEALAGLQMVAPGDLSVILVGEPGTGKEWAARLIHQLSNRAHAALYTVDCGAVGASNIERELFGYDAITWEHIEIKRSAFEEASGGTLFLHDFEIIPVPVQLRVARAVEYRQFRKIGGDGDQEVNIRLIASTSRAAGAEVLQGLRGVDIESRLGAITITLPPLRDRKTDIPVLIERFLNEMRDRYLNPVQGISREALSVCCEFCWPGNVRQLKNAMEFAAIMSGGGLIHTQHLPAYLHNHPSISLAGS
jgi:DNA-binding NtrC family response regulator